MWEVSGVKVEDLSGPPDLVHHPLALGLLTAPEFEVLGAVVGSVAVDVVNRFIGPQFTAELLLHDVSVLHDAATPAGVIGVGEPEPHITLTRKRSRAPVGSAVALAEIISSAGVT